jgi:hypothetical protein
MQLVGGCADAAGGGGGAGVTQLSPFQRRRTVPRATLIPALGQGLALGVYDIACCARRLRAHLVLLL